MSSQGQWVTMKEASRILSITYGVVSRLVAIKAISTKENLADRRSKLVNIDEIKNVLSQ